MLKTLWPSTRLNTKGFSSILSWWREPNWLYHMMEVPRYCTQSHSKNAPFQFTFQPSFKDSHAPFLNKWKKSVRQLIDRTPSHQCTSCRWWEQKRKRSTILVPADEMAAVFKTLKKLDSERYFALPVTDEIAPLYSKVSAPPITTVDLNPPCCPTLQTQHSFPNTYYII